MPAKTLAKMVMEIQVHELRSEGKTKTDNPPGPKARIFANTNLFALLIIRGPRVCMPCWTVFRRMGN